MLDWNDLRHFLAVAETGSTLAAGRRLRVSQTTVARRVAALEAATGLVLFERRAAGYALTPAGEALVARADAVAAAATTFEASAAAERRDVGGTVRLTLSEILSTTILPPILRDLHEAHPDIRIELDTTDIVRDLDAGEADIALRNAVRPVGPGLVGRRLLDDAWTVYCSRAYAAEHGHPTRRSQLSTHGFIGGGEPGVWRSYQAWLRDNGFEGAVTMQHSTSSGLLSAVRAGLGLAVLPCLVADREADLLRCLPPMPQVELGLWLLTHERLRHTPRVRTVVDFLADRLGALARERPA